MVSCHRCEHECKTLATRYMTYWMWPVVDDAGAFEYWDVHDPEDNHGEGDPVAQGFRTVAQAKQYIRERRREDMFIDSLDRALLRMDKQ